MQNQGTKRLETERLVLRPFIKEDAEYVYKNWASDDEVTKFLTWSTHKSVDDSKGYIDFCLNGYQDVSSYQWGIELKDSGEVIGNISVVHMNNEIESAELGWVLGKAWWGCGIMPEAAREIIRFLFEEVGVNRICAEHDTNNQKSGRVMQKIGMRHEGTLRGAGKNNQGIVDMDVYGITKTEWQKIHKYGMIL